MMNNYYDQSNNSMVYNPLTNRYEPVYGYSNNIQPHENTFKPQMSQYAFVNGIEGAKSYQIGPNKSILLMDADSNICFRKETDAQGKASIRYFELKEIDEQTAKTITNPITPKINFVTKEEIEDILNKRFENFDKRLDDIFKKLDKSNNRKEVKDNG